MNRRARHLELADQLGALTQDEVHALVAHLTQAQLDALLFAAEVETQERDERRHQEPQ